MPYPKGTLVPSLAAFATAAAAFQGFGPPEPPPPFDDHAQMMRQLGIKAIRPGPDPNDPSTSDEATADRYRDTMPDVLRRNDGTKVTSAAGWPRRRKEIVELFEREVYGRVPKDAPRVDWEVTGVTPGESGGIPTVTKTLVGHVDNRRYPKVKVDIQASYTVPANATAPVPMMVEFGGFGPLGRRGDAKPWTQQAIERGWGYGSLNPGSIQPDSAHLERGVIGLCNRGRPRKPEDWGALRAWAWGLSRLIDHFERDENSKVDPRKVGIEGVSRYGKAALVAQAFDPRVAVGFVGSSGEGGAKLHRHVFGEAIENLAGGEFYWMAGNLIKYGASDPPKTVADLPVDSHELIALCAPRPCFLSHGIVEKGDAKWIDAHGAFMAAVLAGPVYRLLGGRDLGTPGDYLTDPMPPVNRLVGGDLAWRQHDGGHEVTPNWPAFFDWIAAYVPAPPLPQDRTPYRPAADVPASRTDSNSLIAHGQLLQKAAKGGIDVYFEGDSITRRWGTSDAAWKANYDNWKANFWGWNAADFGWGADSTQNVLWRLKNGELDGVNPKVVVLLAGTNNVSAGAKPEAIVRGLKAIVDVCRRKAPGATIVLTAIFPRLDNPALQPVVDAVNRGLAKLADGRRVRFLDVNGRLTDPTFFIDGLHPSVKGYQVWADGLKPILTELLGPPAVKDHAPAPTGDPSATPSPGRVGGSSTTASS